MELKLPIVATVLHNTKHKFLSSITSHVNAAVRYVHRVCNAVSIII